MTPTWVERLLGGPVPPDGETFERCSRTLVAQGGIIRDLGVADLNQAQTRDAFAFKWSKRDSYTSESMREVIGPWLRERYGDLVATLGPTDGRKPMVLDAGCGSGNAASILFETCGDAIRYVGADISEAVDLAQETLAPHITESLFLQADLTSLPFEDRTFDIVLSEGVLHHTSSTRNAIAATARLIRPGGIYAIYVYKKKAPVREFTDDFVREQIAALPPEQAWELLLPLTKLGKALGDIDAEIDVPEDIALLGIPKGRISVQRLLYWNFCKLFYRPELSLDEMNHINFDWYMPKNCHRQTPEEVRTWCEAEGLEIVSLKIEEAGITVIAKRPAASG